MLGKYLVVTDSSYKTNLVTNVKYRVSQENYEKYFVGNSEFLKKDEGIYYKIGEIVQNT